MATMLVRIVFLGLFMGFALAVSGCESKPFPYYIPPHGNVR